MGLACRQRREFYAGFLLWRLLPLSQAKQGSDLRGKSQRFALRVPGNGFAGLEVTNGELDGLRAIQNGLYNFGSQRDESQRFGNWPFFIPIVLGQIPSLYRTLRSQVYSAKHEPGQWP